MNTNDLRHYLLSHAPWVDPDDTVDQVLAGDPSREIHRVAVAWMATLYDLQAQPPSGATCW